VQSSKAEVLKGTQGSRREGELQKPVRLQRMHGDPSDDTDCSYRLTK
jgi:hypothetical protein